MEDQLINEAQQTEEPRIQFIDEEEVQKSREQEYVQLDPEPVFNKEEFVSTETNNQTDNIEYSQEDVERAVFNFLSERLGRNVSSFDDLQMQQQRELDERVLAIADFVKDTGRDPQDWFYYQSLNPSEMDDATAIQMQMLSDYPNLSQEEVSLLISSKYKLDPNLHTENEVKLSQLQLKIDAESARKSISQIREQYAAPEKQQQSFESLVNDDWVANMTKELNDLESIEFDLGNGNSFRFGLRESYKRELADKNARLDEFFDPYVRGDGSWDFDKLNIHRSVIDNIDSIVQSVYKQGMADGQRTVVNNAANVKSSTPAQGNEQQGSTLAQQLREALGLNRGFGSYYND